MRAIPRKLLIHSGTMYRRDRVDKWGKTVLDEGQELSSVRLEPSRQIVRDKNNAEVQLAATLFFDCRNSRPSGYTPQLDDVFDFDGQRFQVRLVEPLYDGARLHHYEIGMVRYGKD